MERIKSFIKEWGKVLIGIIGFFLLGYLMFQQDIHTATCVVRVNNQDNITIKECDCDNRYINVGDTVQVFDYSYTPILRSYTTYTLDGYKLGVIIDKY